MAQPRQTLNLVVREIMAHAKVGDRVLGEGFRVLLRGAAALVAAAYDGGSNPERVERVRAALEVIDC